MRVRLKADTTKGEVRLKADTTRFHVKADTAK